MTTKDNIIEETFNEFLNHVENNNEKSRLTRMKNVIILTKNNGI